jgi:Fuc2NAc and GlcNAc transferase
MGRDGCVVSERRMIGVLLAVAVATAIGTGVVRRMAIRKALLDVPTDRSSHARPTPRGGGLGFVVTILATLTALGIQGALDRHLAFAAVPSGAVIAAIGLVDDRAGLSRGIRFLAHALCAIWVVCWIGPPVGFGFLAWPVAVLALVWLMNLFNFMDGIDGIAAGTAFTTGLAGGLVCLAAGSTGPAWIGLVTAAGALGFLPWNWMPARIFMGDVGSVFLGLMLGIAGLAAHNEGAVPAALWALLLGTFLFDATLTLARRIARREEWRSAHRSHAYQRAVQSGLSHATVTAAVLLTNAVLAGLVALAVHRPGREWVVIATGLGLLIALYLAVERRKPMSPPASRNGSRIAP